MFIATGSGPELPERSRRQEPLGQILKWMELISEAQIQEALHSQRERGGVIGQILVDLGYVAEEEVHIALAFQTGTEIVGPESIIPAAMEKTLEELRDHVRFEPLEKPAGPAGLRDDDLANWAPVVKLVNLILITALKAGATELRLENTRDRSTVQYRVDGVLHDMESPPLHLAIPMLNRLLSESGLDVTQRVRPQEQGVRLVAAGRKILATVRFTPGSEGESVVMQFSKDSGISG